MTLQGLLQNVVLTIVFMITPILRDNQIFIIKFRGLSKKVPGDMGFNWMGHGETTVAKYRSVELRQGRAAMIAMASLFAMKSIPGSVPIMDLLGAN